MTDIRILIVEDEPLIAEDIAETLQNMDYQVAGIAYSSDKALDMLAVRQPDLALLDINIKGPQNGIDLGRIIHKKYKIPFLFLTSYGDRQTIYEAKKKHALRLCTQTFFGSRITQRPGNSPVPICT